MAAMVGCEARRWRRRPRYRPVPPATGRRRSWSPSPGRSFRSAPAENTASWPARTTARTWRGRQSAGGILELVEQAGAERVALGDPVDGEDGHGPSSRRVMSDTASPVVRSWGWSGHVAVASPGAPIAVGPVGLCTIRRRGLPFRVAGERLVHEGERPWRLKPARASRVHAPVALRRRCGRPPVACRRTTAWTASPEALVGDADDDRPPPPPRGHQRVLDSRGGHTLNPPETVMSALRSTMNR